MRVAAPPTARARVPHGVGAPLARAARRARAGLRGGAGFSTIVGPEAD
jgi:hypothetical protein